MQIQLPTSFAISAVLMVCLSGHTRAQSPRVLVDANSTMVPEPSSEPREFAAIGTQVLFAAQTPEAGHELWTVDVATGNAALVADIRPSFEGSNPIGIVALGGNWYFTADDGVHGRELWRSDGTAAGTWMLRDIMPGPGSPETMRLVMAGGALHFSARSPSGAELWRSDGTTSGTQEVVDLEPGPGSSDPVVLTAIGNQLMFQAWTSSTGSELWRSDGTAAGTVLVADLEPGPASSWPHALVELGTWTLFGAGNSLWRTDGTTAGTLQVATPGPSEMVRAGNRVFYVAWPALYVSDGTAANTHLLATIASGSGDWLGHLVPLGSGCALIRTAGGTSSLWVSDGTAGGTVEVQAPVERSTAPVVLGNRLLFAASSQLGLELWETDGSIGGTHILADLRPGAESSFPGNLVPITPNQVIFAAHDARGREPWLTDGTAGGTRRLVDLVTSGGATWGSGATEFVDAGGIAYFVADDGSGATLWRTDGSLAGTFAVMPPGSGRPVQPRGLRAAGTKVYFVATGSLWVSDGTAAGTRSLLGGVVPPDVGEGLGFVVAEDLVYCWVQWGPNRGLWRTDGTTQGTLQLVSPAANSHIDGFAALGRGLVFARSISFIPTQPSLPGPYLGSEPYYTDGTVDGTVLLADIVPGAGSSGPAQFTTLGDRCFFTVFGNSGFYVTDGTPAGTQPFVDLLPGSGDRYDRLAVAGRHLYFRARTAVHGDELWKTDGTVGGTALVRDVVPGPMGLDIAPLRAVGDVLFYNAIVDTVGLWRTDGTAAGTYKLLGQEVTRFAGGIDRYGWFAARDAEGVELWRTDGTVAGTARYADLMPGAASSEPTRMAISNGQLLFGANDRQFGAEPWVLPLGASAQAIGHACTPVGGSSRLTATTPVLGTTLVLQGHDAPSQGLGITLVSFPTAASFRFPGGSCDWFLDPNLVVLAISPLAQGAFVVPWSLPGDPAFAGLQVRAQSLLLPNASLIGAEATNAVALVTGF